MSSQLTPSGIHHLSYQVPRIVVGSTGKNRPFHDGQMKIVAGSFAPLEFYFSGEGNKPLNLVPFTVKLVFWKFQPIDMSDPMGHYSTEQDADIIASVVCETPDPYSGTAHTLLTDEHTEMLRLVTESGGVRWGVFLITEDKQVYPMTVSSSGATHGTVVMAPNSMPSYTAIIGS